MLVTIEIEVDTRDAAEGLVAQYNGVVADGNALSVSIKVPRLAERFDRGGAGGGAANSFGGSANGGARTSGQALGAYSQPRQEAIVPRSSG